MSFSDDRSIEFWRYEKKTGRRSGDRARQRSESTPPRMSAADRQRRVRARRRRGRMVLPVEIDGEVLDALARSGLTREYEADRAKLAEAVATAIKQWTDEKKALRVTRIGGG